MFSFIKDAFSELEHVVWPTDTESKKYMTYTIGVIIVMASLLAVLWYALGGTLKWVRAQFDHTQIATTAGSWEELATKADLAKIQADLAKKRMVLSGASLSLDTGSGKSMTGVTTTPIDISAPSK